MAAARPARAARRRPAGGGGRGVDEPRYGDLVAYGPEARLTSPSGSATGESCTRPAAAVVEEQEPATLREIRRGFFRLSSLGRTPSIRAKGRPCRKADIGAVDAAERQEILNRYMDHSRRFEAAAARRSNGSAEVIPFTPPIRELEQEPTMREIEVLQLVSEGLVNREIGQRLFLSEETVKSHVRHLLAKLQARSRAHAVAVGFRRGLIGNSLRQLPDQADAPGGETRRGLQSPSRNLSPVSTACGEPPKRGMLLRLWNRRICRLYQDFLSPKHRERCSANEREEASLQANHVDLQ